MEKNLIPLEVTQFFKYSTRISTQFELYVPKTGTFILATTHILKSARKNIIVT